MSTRDRIICYAESADIEMILLEPNSFDEAILGVAIRADGKEVIAYDYMVCVEVLMRDGMDREEAEEYLMCNTVSAWMGEGTPVFIDRRYAE